MKRKIWILGSSNLDSTYAVRQLPSKGMTVLSGDVKVATGGKGANQAICAAHWGAEVHFIGAVGDDETGRLLLKALTDHGIQVGRVAVVSGTASGHAIILIDGEGDNVIVVHGGANLRVPTTVPAGFPIGRNDIFVSQLENNLDALEAYITAAKNNGAFTILNPSPFRELPPEILGRVDLVVANEDEASQLGEVRVEDLHTASCCGAAIQKRFGVKNIIITLGSQGAVLVGPRRSFAYPPYRVKVLDTQGAGDAFTGSLAAKLSESVSIEQAVSFANWVAAQSVTHPGSTQASLPQPFEASGVHLDRYSEIEADRPQAPSLQG